MWRVSALDRDFTPDNTVCRWKRRLGIFFRPHRFIKDGIPDTPPPAPPTPAELVSVDLATVMSFLDGQEESFYEEITR